MRHGAIARKACPWNDAGLFVLAHLGLWVGVGIILARVGGWATLADVYCCSGEFLGDRRRFLGA